MPMHPHLDMLFPGDAISLLRDLEDDSVDLVLTSPPYAGNRKGTYQGVHVDQYVAWFTPYAEELLRVLKPDGSFILNIKERAHKGERHTYVLELILEMKGLGWYWIEEYIWHSFRVKKNRILSPVVDFTSMYDCRDASKDVTPFPPAANIGQLTATYRSQRPCPAPMLIALHV